LFHNIEYGATTGFFPVDAASVEYLRQTNRSQKNIEKIEAYLNAVGLMRNFQDEGQDPVFSQVGWL
jgi:aconitate hydratase